MVLSRYRTAIRGSASSWIVATLDHLNPGVGEAGIDEEADAAVGGGVAVIGITTDDDGTAGGVVVDVSKYLVDARTAGVSVALLITGLVSSKPQR